MAQPDKPGDRPAGPRRGANPTPKKIVEDATPYVPDKPPEPTPKPAPAKPRAE
jgi:hypothetical protein